MLDNKDTSFVTWWQGVGARAGFGTIGGGKAISGSKRRKKPDVSTDLLQVTQKLAKETDKITTNTNNAINKLFSPSSSNCTFSVNQ